MPASWSTFSSRWIARVRSSAWVLRRRVRSRRRRISGGGTKLGRTSPSSSSSHSQRESITSLFRPGTLCRCSALISQHSNRRSSTKKTGFQVDAGRLHPDQRDGEALEPVAQLLELGDRGAERARLLRAPTATLALARHAHGGNDAVAVHIKARAALDDHVHQTTSFRYDKTASSGGASHIRFCGSRSRQHSTIPQAPAPYSLTRS